MAKKKQENKPKISVYSKMKSERIAGKFDKKNAKVIRKLMVCSDTWVDDQEGAFKMCGIFYTKNEDATKKYLAGDKYKS